MYRKTPYKFTVRKKFTAVEIAVDKSFKEKRAGDAGPGKIVSFFLIIIAKL